MHTYEEYPHGGWHYVVAKDNEGEARFLHSIQIEKKKFSTAGNYFQYSYNGGGIFDAISVSVSRIPDLRFHENMRAGYIAISPNVLMSEAYQQLEKITGKEFPYDDLVGNFRARARSIKWDMGFFEGESVTKSQYETYKLLTNLPVLTCRPW